MSALSFHPDIPVPVLAVLGLALLGFCVWRLVVERGKRIAWARRGLLVLLAVAMAFRPAVPGGEVPTGSIAARVFIMIDTSQSVAAEDWGGEPRLEGMREDVTEIARAFAGADIGVITFDSQPQLRVPLTDDGSAVIEMVRALKPEVGANSRGTSIAIAHEMLRTELERSEAADPASPAIVFYLGDGEHTAAEPPASFSDVAGLVDRGLVLGYGTNEGGRMQVTSFEPDAEPSYVQDASGNDAISKIDTAALEGIANELGVTFLHRQPGVSIEPTLAPMAAAQGEADLTEMEESRLDLAWVFGGPVALLLAWELFVLARALGATRHGFGTSGPRPSRAGGGA